MMDLGNKKEHDRKVAPLVDDQLMTRDCEVLYLYPTQITIGSTIKTKDRGSTYVVTHPLRLSMTP